jgi:hypothetical protein
MLSTGDTLRGLLKYDLDDVLHLKNRGQEEILAPQKVLGFEFFDYSYKRNRIFYALPYSASGGRKNPIFFEVLTQGKISLLSREDIAITTTATTYSIWGPKKKKQLAHHYYLLNDQGDINEVRNRTRIWDELMREKATAVHRYARANKLSYQSKYDLKQIIDYYNVQ